MTKWDSFTSLLKDYKLDELLDTLEKRASADKPDQMKQIILTAAYEGRDCNSYHGRKIITKIIEVILNENQQNYVGNQNQNRKEYAYQYKQNSDNTRDVKNLTRLLKTMKDEQQAAEKKVSSKR